MSLPCRGLLRDCENRWIVYSSIYSPFVHPLHRHLRRDGLVKDPLHICLCEYLWTRSSAAADTRLLTPGRRCDHDSNVRRLLISDGWICWEYHCRPQPEICQHLCRDDLCILLSRYLLTLRFTLLHNLQFRYTKYVCSKISDTSTSLFSVENAILVPRPGDWDLVTIAATPRIFYYPAALGRGYPHICKN